MVTIELLSAGIAASSSGRGRRFFVGLAATAVVSALVFWMAPLSLRRTLLTRVVMPLDARIGRRVPNPRPFMGSTSVLESSLFYWEVAYNPPQGFRGIWPSPLRPLPAPDRFTRVPFLSTESQAWLSGVQLAVATLGGLIAARKTTRSPVGPSS